MTERLELQALRALSNAGYDVVIGKRKAPGAAGWYVSLEHLDLGEPEEFKADSMAEALAAAWRWEQANAQQPRESVPSWLVDFRAAVRARLKEDGLKQADLARKLGVSQKHVSQVLSGNVAGSPAFLERVAGAVGLRISTCREQQR